MQDKTQAERRAALALEVKNKAERDQEYHNNFHNIQQDPMVDQTTKDKLKKAYEISAFANADYFSNLDKDEELKKIALGYKIYDPQSHPLPSKEVFEAYIKSPQSTNDIETFSKEVQNLAQVQREKTQLAQSTQSVITHMTAHILDVNTIRQFALEARDNPHILNSIPTDADRKKYQNDLSILIKALPRDNHRVLDMNIDDQNKILGALQPVFRTLSETTNSIKGANNQQHFNTIVATPFTDFKAACEQARFIKTAKPDVLKGYDRELKKSMKTVGINVDETFDQLDKLRTKKPDHTEEITSVKSSVEVLKTVRANIKRQERHAATQADFLGLTATRIENLQKSKEAMAAYLNTHKPQAQPPQPAAKPIFDKGSSKGEMAYKKDVANYLAKYPTMHQILKESIIAQRPAAANDKNKFNHYMKHCMETFEKMCALSGKDPKAFDNELTEFPIKQQALIQLLSDPNKVSLRDIKRHAMEQGFGQQNRIEKGELANVKMQMAMDSVSHMEIGSSPASSRVPPFTPHPPTTPHPGSSPASSQAPFTPHPPTTPHPGSSPASSQAPFTPHPPTTPHPGSRPASSQAPFTPHPPTTPHPGSRPASSQVPPFKPHPPTTPPPSSQKPIRSHQPVTGAPHNHGR